MYSFSCHSEHHIWCDKHLLFWIVIAIQIMLHYSPAELARPPVVMGDGAVPVRLALVLLILPRLRGAPEESLECAKL